MIIEHATLINIKMSISYAFLIEILFFFKIFNCGSLSLHGVLDFLVLPEQRLLFLLKPANVLFHGYYLRCKLMHGSLELLISVLLIGQVILHVLINTVYVFFLVEKIVLLRGPSHQGT